MDRNGGGAGGEVVTRLVDQTEHHLTGALQVSAGLRAGELHLLASDLHVGGNGCELSVNSICQIGDELAQARYLGVELRCLLVSEDPVFSQRLGCFLTNVHRSSFHFR